jgi:hypothetical protein
LTKKCHFIAISLYRNIARQNRSSDEGHKELNSKELSKQKEQFEKLVRNFRAKEKRTAPTFF